MKKLLVLSALVILTACQAPYSRTVAQQTGPRVCVEYYDSFRCSAPQRMWHEEVYPKNIQHMGHLYGIQQTRPTYSLSQTVYGTM